MINNKNNHIITGIIVLVSIAGIIYFGYNAITDNTKQNQENPFELNLDMYKKNTEALNLYAELESITVELEKPKAICFDRQDNLYVGGKNEVIRYNSERMENFRITVSGQVYCLAADSRNRLYAGVDDHIEIYAGIEKVSQWESLGENSIITSIAVTSNRIYLADAGGKVVWKFNQDGRLLGRIGERNPGKGIEGFTIPSPYFDVAVDPSGNLWAANTGNHRLEQYEDGGALVRSWGEYSMKIEGFCGCCNPANFAFLPDGSFVTGEKGLPRVKVYSAEGRLTAVVAAPDLFKDGAIGRDLTVSSTGRIYVLDPNKNTVRIFEKKSNSEGGN